MVRECVRRFSGAVRPCRGFALAELMVCVVLMSVLAAAVGLAVHGAQRRSAEAQVRFAQVRKGSRVCWTIREHMQFANQIISMGPSGIAFVYADLAAGTPTTVNYSCHDGGLYRSVNGAAAEVFASDIYHFDMSYDTVQREDGKYYIRAVNVTVQLGDDTGETFQQYIPLMNTPQKP